MEAHACPNERSSLAVDSRQRIWRSHQFVGEYGNRGRYHPFTRKSLRYTTLLLTLLKQTPREKMDMEKQLGQVRILYAYHLFWQVSDVAMFTGFRLLPFCCLYSLSSTSTSAATTTHSCALTSMIFLHSISGLLRQSDGQLHRSWCWSPRSDRTVSEYASARSPRTISQWFNGILISLSLCFPSSMDSLFLFRFHPSAAWIGWIIFGKGSGSAGYLPDTCASSLTQR